MSPLAPRPNLENLVRSWWDAAQAVRKIEQDIADQQILLDGASCTLDLIEDDIGRAAECYENTLVYTVGGATVVLAWQEEKEYHTIELATPETL